MRHILKYIRPLWGCVALTLFIKFVASLMELLIPSILAKMIDDVVPLGDRRLIVLSVRLSCFHRRRYPGYSILNKYLLYNPAGSASRPPGQAVLHRN